MKDRLSPCKKAKFQFLLCVLYKFKPGCVHYVSFGHFYSKTLNFCIKHTTGNMQSIFPSLMSVMNSRGFR